MTGLEPLYALLVGSETAFAWVEGNFTHRKRVEPNAVVSISHFSLLNPKKTIPEGWGILLRRLSEFGVGSCSREEKISGSMLHFASRTQDPTIRVCFTAWIQNCAGWGIKKLGFVSLFSHEAHYVTLGQLLALCPNLSHRVVKPHGGERDYAYCPKLLRRRANEKCTK